MGSMVYLLNIFLTIPILIISQTINECDVSFNSNLVRESDARLIGGYNDVLGPVQNLTYFDSGLLLTSTMLYNGILRHPGGTVANYWTFKNASYTQPCNTSHYNNCKHQEVVEKLPPQTFSPSNFSKGLGNNSLVYKTNNNNINTRNHGVVYDMNLLTLEGQQMLDEVNVLYTEVGADNIRYIELGNEFYLNQYQYEFPNSTVYMNKALPVIAQIRKLFGNNTKISVPAERTLPGHKSEWNAQLVEFKEYYDSVTVHDYSMAIPSNLSQQDQLSFISIYGKAALPQWIEYVQTEFGKEYTIWMTEYNTFLSNATWGYSVLHSMFAMSYITTAICDETQTMELLMWHLYATQIGNGWGTYDYTTTLSAKVNDPESTTFNVVAQIFGHLGYISMIKNNKMTCLDFTNSNSNNCPLLGINVFGNSKLQCLFGSGFNNDSDVNSFGFVIVNSCQYQISINLNIKSMANLNSNQMLNTWQYDYKQDGGNDAKYSNCKSGDNVWDKECASVYANYKQINIDQNQQTLTIKIDALSLILAST